MTASTLSNIDFATEVKADRLNFLWRLTAVVSALVLLMAVAFATAIPSANIQFWVLTPAILMVGCMVTGWLLQHRTFETAALVYTVSGLMALGAALYTTDELIIQLVPFGFTVVVFIGGLLLTPAQSIIMAILSSALIVLLPALATGSMVYFGGYQVFAIVMLLVGAGLAAQVTGELYTITEWALENYKRERRTNDALFESRRKLEWSLKRSEALGDELQGKNEELATAWAAAEAAKNFRGQFLANMSHELRTPLNAIIGFSETMLTFPMMYDGVELPDLYRHDMEQIYNSGRQLLILINDILDLAKVDAGKLQIAVEPVAIEPVLETVQSMAQGLIGAKPISLKTELPSPLPTVMADENRLRQVLVNLYSNAVKFTDRGHITLTVRRTKEGVQFSVRDTGSGISKSALPHIFEEFRQGDNHTGRDPRAGAGLGLAISRQLVTMMNGRIWAESTLNQGSVFHFMLPSAEDITRETRRIRPTVDDHDDETGEVLISRMEE